MTWLTTAYVEWNALLTILAPGACQTVSVEYKRPCRYYFHLEQGLLRMTHCYTNEGGSQSRLFLLACILSITGVLIADGLVLEHGVHQDQ